MPDPIHAGDRLLPLPSEVLASLDSGRGIAGFLLRPADLDRLLVLRTGEPVEPVNLGPPRTPVERALGDYRAAIIGPGAPDLDDPTWDMIRLAFRAGWQRALEWAERSGDPSVLDGFEEQADALRAEVARLTALLDEQGSDGYLADAEEWQPDPALGASPEVVALMRLDRILGNEHALSARGTGRVRGVVLDALRDWHARQPSLATREQTGQPIDRPHPAANAWPDDAVTISYAELRKLVALHLTIATVGLTRDRPWLHVKAQAKAVADGEAPLLLDQVLE